MSETSVRSDVSSESLCTVIENCTDNNNLLSLKRHSPQHHDNQHDNIQEHHQHHPPSTFYNDDVIYKQHNSKFCSDEDDDDSKDTESGICDEESIRIVESHEDLRKLDSPESTPSTNGDLLNNSLESNCDSGGQSGQDQVDDAGSPEPQPISKPPPPATKLKKSVSFDPNDEKVRKFIAGEPIVDQRNPFKGQTSPNASLLNGKAKKKTPPPVPARRSTLSVRKTVTQQLREREREKEKDRERAKNDTNQRKSSGGSLVSSPSDEFVTTEEVLKQSKYVKTYIKNPDPVFVYDPTVLARIKFEELRELADKKPPKKLKLSTQTRDRLPNVKPAIAAKPVTFKKCSKPNYPELSDIKVRVGPEATDDEPSFNAAEVTKNAKKFDERVKKLLIGSDDDLDEIDEPLTKSESSDEVTLQAAHRDRDETDGAPADIESPTDLKNLSDLEEDLSEMKAGEPQQEPSKEPCGTFTNTIKSKEFQEYLDKKGLSLIPKKIPAGAQAVYTVNGGVKLPRSNNHISFAPSPERVQLSINRMAGEDGDSDGGKKKPSVFQRLLAHSIFASRRKTTPKETVPMPRRIGAYGQSVGGGKDPNSIVKTPSPIRRVVLERQSFHGRPRASNLLSSGELRDLKNQTERSRKSFASGDDLSLSISSALTNAEDAEDAENKQPQQPVPQPRRSAVDQLANHSRPMVKPPRRSVSKDRLPNGHYQDSLSRTKVPLPGAKAIPLSLPRSPNEGLETAMGVGEPMPIRRATLERQSLIPRRTMTPNSVAERRQVFGRTASMDRNEILKRNTNRGPPRSRSALGTAMNKLPATTPMESRDNLEESQFSVMNGPKMTSTPIREQNGNQQAERKALSAMPSRQPPPGVVYVDPQEWERLRAIKERTDKELYYKMLQQQQQQQQQQTQPQQRQEPDRIYEKVPQTQTQVIVEQHQPPSTTAATMNGAFVRGSPQRNTFSGVMPQRQTKINDGRATMQPAAESNERSQSVLDGMTLAGRRNFRRGYESENETPVIMRRQKGEQPGAGENQQEPRRIGGLLTREEILAKVKEFCRKSLNKTPQPAHMQAIYEKQTDLSPVSYASVETQHLRPGSRMYAAPQVPQRFQSLQPQQFIPIQSTHELMSQRPMAPIQQQQQLQQHHQQFIDDPTTTTAATTTTTAQMHPNPSPIYAHVIKRSSLQSNQSGGTADLYDTPQPIRQYIVRRDSEAPLQPVYITHPSAAGSMIALQPQRGGENGLAPAQYVIVDSEKLSPRQVYNYYQTEVYAQPQYIRPHQVLQPIAAAAPGSAPYGYISVREPAGATVVATPQQQHQLRARLLDGRSTPLILDRSSQQASQIYWTPQHQRLQQQHTGLMPVHISPRYTMKQSATMSPAVYGGGGGSGQPATLQRFSNVMQQQHEQLYTINTNIPQQQQQQQHQQQHQQQSSMDSPNSKQQMVQRGSNVARKIDDWESGSEAGEVQRIMEQQNKNAHAKSNSRPIMDSGSSDEKTTTTPPNQPTPASSTPTTTTHTDDESSSLTTSTESELLGTWTLVTDKAKLKLANEADAEKTQELSPELKKAIDEAAAMTRMEELPDSPDDLEDGGFEEDDTKESKTDTTLDDFSDGISIISESDSGGRLSPHPFMRAHLQDIGSFHLGHEEPALSPKLPIVIDDSEAAAELRQRRRKRSSSRSKEMPAEGKALQPQRPSSTLAEAAPPLLPTIVRRGLSGIFYVGVAVALLALYGKMSNPEWEPLSAAKQPMAELQQKVIDMELQNNLMRAEIDILSRQVNYLSNAKHQMPPPTPGQQPNREERPRGKGGKHFKAWPGNGERLEPVDIDKDDLKRPYKCADGHIEIGGMCVEDRPDSFVNTVEEVLDTLQGNTAAEDSDLDPAKRMKPDSRRPEPAQFDAPPPPPPPPQPQQPEESRQRFGEQKYQKDFKPHNSREQYQKQRPNSKERFGKENRYPKNGGSGDGGLSKEQFRKRFKADEAKNASPESGERFKRESHEKRRGGGGDSKEQWRKQPHPKGSGEHHHQARGSGEWHEKLMQQRENSRRQHEQKRNDKNWYIERGAGREHMRYS